jgi:gamma-glutamylputrescine oxidase
VGASSDHVASLYAATADSGLAFAALDGNTRVDVAILGGGNTGHSTAHQLAEAGVDALVLEANRVGWGASGRNGGQLHTGQRRDQDWLEERLGLDFARNLWGLAEDAKALTRQLIAKHSIDCDWREGVIEAVHKQRLVPGEIDYVDKLREDYGYQSAYWLDRDALTEAIGTPVYFGGRRDTGAGHLDPLKFAQGLAKAAATAGARICENTRAVRLTGSAQAGFAIACAGGAIVTADMVILAGNGYLDGINGEIETRVLPIDNYILATEPIGAGQHGGIIHGGEGVSDTRFVVHYFRPSADGRLIFGGGETYSRTPPPDIAAFVRRYLARIYPDLAETRVDYAWGGTLAITMHRLPFIPSISSIRARPGYHRVRTSDTALS